MPRFAGFSFIALFCPLGVKGDPGSNYQEAVSSAYSPVRRVSRRAGETRILGLMKLVIVACLALGAEDLRRCAALQGSPDGAALRRRAERLAEASPLAARRRERDAASPPE